MSGDGEDIFSSLAFEFAPAAIFGSAVAFAASRALALPPFGMEAVAVGAALFGLALLVLRRLGASSRRYALPEFEIAEFEPEEADSVDELILALSGPQDRAAAEEDELLLDEVASASTSEELVLDDVLKALDPESRVVQLFDPAKSPTAGELHARIERHLRSGPRVVPDATHELREALSALRQSLR